MMAVVMAACKWAVMVVANNNRGLTDRAQDSARRHLLCSTKNPQHNQICPHPTALYMKQQANGYIPSTPLREEAELLFLQKLAMNTPEPSNATGCPTKLP